jgi:DNA repair protein RadC
VCGLTRNRAGNDIFANNYPNEFAELLRADELLTANVENRARVDIGVLDHFIVAGETATGYFVEH